MQSQIKVDDWHLIKDKNDIKNLDEASELSLCVC